MTKELEALEIVRKELIKCHRLPNETHYDELDIIETALKEYEGAKNHIKALNEERIENSLKLKALEIIKKYVAIDELINDGDFFMYSIRDKQYISSRSCLVMTNEEYELLKEVLNND